MSRLGDFFSRTFAQARSHEPSWIQHLPSMPGSPQSLQDAFIANRWSHPYGSEQNSMDIFAGGVGHPAGSEHPWARTAGRAVGSYFLGQGLNNFTGTNWAGSAARSAGGLLSGGTPGSPGGFAGNAASMPEDNSMIAPIPVHDEFQNQGNQVPAGLLAMLLAQQGGQPDEPQGYQQPYISARGLA